MVNDEKNHVGGKQEKPVYLCTETSIMNLSEYLLCCLNILVQTEDHPPADRQTEPSAAVWLLSNSTPWLLPAYSTLPAYILTVAMVIEAGVSSDGPTTDIRAKTSDGCWWRWFIKPTFKVHLNHNKPISMQRIEYIKLVEKALSLFIIVFILHSAMHERLNERTNKNLNKRHWSVLKIKLTISFRSIMFMRRVCRNLLLNNWLLQC